MVFLHWPEAQVMNNSMLLNLKRKFVKQPHAKVFVVFKGRHPFLTNLDGLEFTSASSNHSCISILIMNSFYAKTTPGELLTLFDFVCWFDGGDYWKGDSLARMDRLSFPEVDEMINKLVQVAPASQLRLIAMEESFVRFTALLREKYKIPGPKTVDTEPFTSKVRMKILARTQKIPVPKFQIISPAGLLTSDENLSSLEETVGYPMVLKPAQGVGGAGVYKLSCREELLTWLRNHGSGYAVYLAEEYVEAVLYNVFALVQKNNVQFFPTALVVRRSTVLESLNVGCPLAVTSWSPEECVELSERAVEFGRQILDSLNPYPNALVFIQMFLTTQPDSEFKFSKIAYRVPDTMSCITLQQNTGISPETVHIMAQLKRLNLTDFSKQCKYFGNVVYPYKAGVLEFIPDLPVDKLTSETELVAMVKEGTRLEKAQNAGDVVVKVYLWHADHSLLMRDINYLCDNYRPVIV